MLVYATSWHVFAYDTAGGSVESLIGLQKELLQGAKLCGTITAFWRLLSCRQLLSCIGGPGRAEFWHLLFTVLRTGSLLLAAVRWYVANQLLP